jgi:hypothetical protein
MGELGVQLVGLLGLVIAPPVMLPAIWRLRSRRLSSAAEHFT